MSASEALEDFSEQILDAAYDELSEFGLRRASIDGVAERLGVGRMTVYRRFNSKESLANAVFQRETSRVLSEVEAKVAGQSVHQGVEDGFIAGALTSAKHHLMSRLLEHEPAAALPYTIGAAAARMLGHATEITRAAIANANDANLYHAESLSTVASAMIRLAHSYSLAPPSGGLTEEQMRQVAQQNLLPLLVRVERTDHDRVN